MSGRHTEADATSQVREVYERLMNAFAQADTDRYFECFHERASFVFPGEEVLDSRSAYHAAWLQWQREGQRFTDVVATDVRIRVFGSTAILTHRIQTTVEAQGETSVDRERESIVFSEIGGRWVAIHEHLSPDRT